MIPVCQPSPSMAWGPSWSTLSLSPSTQSPLPHSTSFAELLLSAAPMFLRSVFDVHGGAKSNSHERDTLDIKPYKCLSSRKYGT